MLVVRNNDSFLQFFNSGDVRLTSNKNKASSFKNVGEILYSIERKIRDFHYPNGVFTSITKHLIGAEIIDTETDFVRNGNLFKYAQLCNFREGMKIHLHKSLGVDASYVGAFYYKHYKNYALRNSPVDTQLDRLFIFDPKFHYTKYSETIALRKQFLSFLRGNNIYFKYKDERVFLIKDAEFNYVALSFCNYIPFNVSIDDKQSLVGKYFPDWDPR